MRTVVAAACSIVCASLIAPGVAAAQSTTLPPGGSEADQYAETVPGDSGDAPIDRGGGAEEVASGEPGGALLSADELRELAAQGRDGQAAAEVAAAGAPESTGGDGTQSPTSTADEGETGPSPNAEGLGFGLPLILAFVAVASLAFAFSRRGTPGTS